MWNIIEYNQIARGERVRLFTACGMFEGTYRGSEEVNDEQWVILTDATLSPCRPDVPKTERFAMEEANLQLNQIIAVDVAGEVE